VGQPEARPPTRRLVLNAQLRLAAGQRRRAGSQNRCGVRAAERLLQLLRTIKGDGGRASGLVCVGDDVRWARHAKQPSSSRCVLCV
jgi:hypothetical protein